MPQTPKSISVNTVGNTANVTAYTVPGGATAVLKTTLASSLIGGNPSITIQKVSGGVSYPLIQAQNPAITPATGGTTFNSRNLVDAPITLTAGDSVTVFDGRAPQWRFAPTSNTFVSSTTTSYQANGMLFANSVYIMTAQDYTNSTSMVLRSTDGVTWTEIATGNLLGSSNYFITNAGNTWVIAQYLTRNTMISTDNGLTWTLSQLPSGTVIYDIESNGSNLWAIGSNNGLYTSSNGTTWTLNSAWSTLINNNTTQFRPQSITWNGTTWFIGNYWGTVITTDFVTYQGLFGIGGVDANGQNFSGVRWSSQYSRWYAAGRRGVNTSDQIFSSTNGITWSYANLSTNVINSWNAKVCVAGTNNIITAKSSNSASTFLRSTDGTTWASATDARGYGGFMEGLANGFFLSCQSQGASGLYYITTDPGTSTGVQGNMGTSAANPLAAASDGTGWIMAWYHGSSNVINCAYGTSGTNITSSSITIDGSGNGGVPYQAVWWAAAGKYIVTSSGGYQYESTNGASWAQGPFTGYVSGNTQGLAVLGNTIYAMDSGSSGVYYLTAAEYNAGSTPNYYAFTTSVYSSAASGWALGSLSVSTINAAGPLATDGTNILISNNRGGITVYTPSLFPRNLRTPGVGGVMVERVNNLDFYYTGVVNQSTSTFGFFYSSNATTTLGNWAGVGDTLSDNFTTTPNSGTAPIFGNISFLSGTYYVTLASDTINYATNLALISAGRYAATETQVGAARGVLPYYSLRAQRRLQTVGGNLVTYSSRSANIATAITSTPTSALCSTSLTLGLVENT